MIPLFCPFYTIYTSALDFCPHLGYNGRNIILTGGSLKWTATVVTRPIVTS